MKKQKKINLENKDKFLFSVKENYQFKAKKGLSEELIRLISTKKKEPLWMRNFRLKAYRLFIKKKLPSWGPDLSFINFEDIYYYIKPTKRAVSSWDDLPREIKKTYDLIGVPQAEKKFLAGVSAQYESEIVYKKIERTLRKLGVIFCSMDEAVQKYPSLIKKYFSKLVPINDNKLATLNSAVWSGGSFVYIPKGVKVIFPLQAYFRINAKNFGQFERTLIIAEEGSYVHYIEGCTAPIYNEYSLHAGVVEIFIKKKARVRYTTVQNWSKNILNLVTKRAQAQEEAIMEWVDCNIGSGLTMKYPAVYLVGKKARGELLSIAFSGKNQTLDAGGKMYHLAPQTKSRIISKSISKDGGRVSYRGLVYIAKGAKNSSSLVNCDALILDKKSISDTYPSIKINEKEVNFQHEARTAKIDEEKLFYLSNRGIKKEEAEGLLVNGFFEPIIREIPLEYSLELNRLINLEMDSNIG